MQYITTQQAAELWGVSPRYVQRLMSENRVAGAQKYGRSWMIPAGAEKPLDPRRGAKSAQPVYFFSPTLRLPKHSVKLARSLIRQASDPLALASIAYYRGDMEPMKQLWYRSTEDDRHNLTYAYLAIVAAACSGDDALYEDVRRHLSLCLQHAENRGDRALLALPEVFVAVSMARSELTPDWLKQCDFSAYPLEVRPLLLRHYVLHLRNIREYPAMLAAAQAALGVCENPFTFTDEDISMGVLCAVAAYALGDEVRARQHLTRAMESAMPLGVITPFADMLGSLGGMLEALTAQQYPALRKGIVELWHSSFKNWMRFHNQFTKENVTTILSPQEYQAAYLIVHGETYRAVSQRMGLSISRVKNILTEVYGKLDIQKKQELQRLIR